MMVLVVLPLLMEIAAPTEQEQEENHVMLPPLSSWTSTAARCAN